MDNASTKLLLAAKLDAARADVAARDAEINTLRSRIAVLDDESIAERLRYENEVLSSELSAAKKKVLELTKRVDVLSRKLDAARPAVALAEAVANFLGSK